MNAETGGSSEREPQRAGRGGRAPAERGGAPRPARPSSRAEAEIKALEADLERQRAEAERDLEQLRLDPRGGSAAGARGARSRRSPTAEERLSEIEAQADAAEQRIEAAERRAAESERTVADERARAREGAAAWLREQLEAIRREAERR